MGYLRGAHGRFAGSTGGRRGSGGGGGGARSRGAAGGRTRYGGRTLHTQKVGSHQVQSRVSTLRRSHVKTYTYKVGKGGVVSKAPGRVATNLANPRFHNPSFRPGTPINSTTRYVSRGHMVTRGMAYPTWSAAMGMGRVHSQTVVHRAVRGKPLKPGYVVSYGKPIPVSRKRP